MTIAALAVSFAMVLSLGSISMGLHEASERRLEDSPRDLIVSSIGLEPSIENVHEETRQMDMEGNDYSDVMPLLTLIGSIMVPDQDDPLTFPPGEGPDGTLEGKRVELGLVGLVPEMASDFIEDGSLIIRSERLGLEGWFEEDGDPFHYSGYQSEAYTGEILLDRNIMDAHDLVEGDVVYFLGPGGDTSASLIISGSVETSLLGAGLVQELVSGIGIIHLGELQYLTGYHERPSPSGNRTDLANAIYIDLEEEMKDPDRLEEVVIELERRFPGLSVSSKESRIYRLEEEVLVLNVFSLGVAVTTLFIGALFLSSIMVLDVEDRRGEISIMRSIGISRRTIYLQILKDSLFLSLAGAAVGIVPGYLGSELLDRGLRSFYGVDMVFSRFSAEVAIFSFLFLMAMVTAFSVLPGIRSTSMDLQKGLSTFNNR